MFNFLNAVFLQLFCTLVCILSRTGLQQFHGSFALITRTPHADLPTLRSYQNVAYSSIYYISYIRLFFPFYVPQLYRQVLLRRVLAMAILSVRPSVRHGPVQKQPSDIETPGLHHMIA